MQIPHLHKTFDVSDSAENKQLATSFICSLCAFILNLLLFGSRNMSDAAILLLYTLFNSLHPIICHEREKESFTSTRQQSFSLSLWKTLHAFCALSAHSCPHSEPLFTASSFIDRIYSAETYFRRTFAFPIPFHIDTVENPLLLKLHCPLCALTSSKTSSIALLLFPFIPRVLPTPVSTHPFLSLCDIECEYHCYLCSQKANIARLSNIVQSHHDASCINSSDLL